MMVRALTEQEAQQIQPFTGPTVRRITPEEAMQLQPLGAPAENAAAQRAESPPPDPGVVKRLIQRFMGSDVDDPLEFERLGTILAFSAGGAKAFGSGGALVAGPPGAAAGTVLGSVLGAAAGAAAPETTLNILEMLGLEGASERGLSDADLRRVAEGEALLEVASLGLFGAARLGGRAIARKASGVTKAGENLAQQAGQIGVELPAVVVGDGKFGKQVLNVLGRFPIVGAKARRNIEAADLALRRAFDELPDRVAPLVTISPENLGFRILDDAKNLFKEVGAKFNARYDDLFLRAKRLGVRVTPRETQGITEAVLEDIAERTPTVAGKVSTPADAASLAKGFLEREVLDLDNLSLAQADELLKKIEQRIATADKGIRKPVALLLMPVHGAVKSDILNNISGDGARQIAEEMAALDSEFSKTMTTLFETATANKFARVERAGIKSAVRRPSEQATQVAVDKLAGIVLDLNSPQSVDELSRLVGKETFQQLGANALKDALAKSVTERAGRVLIDADKLRQTFGVGIRTSGRLKAWERLLSDSGITGQQLETMVEAAQRLGDTPIPNVSTFLARGVTIGGWRRLVSASLPFLAFGSATGGAAGSALSGLAFLGGSRLLTSALSDPRSALPLRVILDKESAALAQRAAFLKLFRIGIFSMGNAGEIASDTAAELSNGAAEWARQAFGPEQEQENEQQ